MSDLAFNAEKHEYRLDGRLVPSVTQIIRAVLPGWQASEWYLQRGRALHHGCRLLDEGKLDWSTVSPEIEPRILAWERFRMESFSTVTAAEVPMACPRYCFAGTCDRVLSRYAEGDIICDLKSTIEAQVRVQLGAYSLLWAANGRKPRKAVAVELRDNGQYRCLWIGERELRMAEQTFLAVLTTFNFMMANNIKVKS